MLWNAHAGQLWQRFTIYLRRRLAASAGIPRSRLPTVLRVSFAKVAEFQARGLVHFHALIRLDGPTGSTTPPPPWAICALLADVIPAAARDAAVTVPAIAGQPARDLRWSTQIDLQPVHPADGCADGDTTEAAVAGYVAKYATKGADAAGTVDHRIRHPSQIAALAVTDYARRMIETCWRLGGRPDYASLNLRRWAHMLGFRGHFTTKSRRYSTTLTALRQARADHRAQHARTHRGDTGHSEQPTASVGTWHYAGSGYTPAEDLLATSIRAHIRTRPPSSDDDPAT